MKKPGGAFLFGFFRMGTEGLWVIALAGFALHLTGGRPFPLLPGVAAFLTAALVARALRGWGWRRIAVLAVHLLGVMVCLAWGLRGAVFFEGGDWRVWGWVVQTAFWVGVLWLKGRAFSRNTGSHERICSQFDKGVAAFGTVFLAAFLIEVRCGLPATWGASLPLFFLFFVLSIAAMGMSAPSDRRRWSPVSYSGAVPALAFAILVAVGGGTMILLLMPLLTQGAEWALEILKTSTAPMGPVLVSFLRFLFTRRRTPQREDRSPASDGPELSPEAGGHELTGIERVFEWGLIGVLGAVLVATMGIVMFFAVKALWGRTRAGRRGVGTWVPDAHWFKQWLRRVRSFSPGAVIRTLRDPGPVRLFHRLSAWGARSGLPRQATETPLEYGTRLCSCFEGLSRDIALLTDLVNREVWSSAPPGPNERRSGLLAWRRLRSPRQWHRRLRILFSAPDFFPPTHPGPPASG